VLLGVLLLSGLVQSVPVVPMTHWLSGNGLVLDSLFGACVGSVATGNPITGYVLAGEFLAAGASYVWVTALIVSWVTVGIVQLPAELRLLGRRFALYRNAVSFLTCVIVAILTVLSLGY
jgi:hypothetical protein